MPINLNETKPKIAVIGAGSWATAIVKILSEKEVDITWWFHKADDVTHLNTFGHNPRYLSGVAIDLKKVTPTDDISEALGSAHVIFLVVPSAHLDSVLEKVPPKSFQHKIVVSAVKGLIAKSNQLVTDYLEDAFLTKKDQLFAIGGPCHAEEVALEKTSFLTIAGPQEKTAGQIAELLACRYIKTSTSTDLYGVEFAAVMKNVVALTCGIAHGLGYGDNFQAVLVSCAMEEMGRFLDKVNAGESNILKSAYLGDLLVTAYSAFSRNRTFGNMIGRGYNVKSAQVELGMVAEGYFAAKSLYEMNESLQVEMPILTTAYRILHLQKSAKTEIEALIGKMR